MEINIILCIHPCLFKIIKLVNDGKEIVEIVSLANNVEFRIECGILNSQEILYYIKKYEFYSSLNWFDNSKGLSIEYADLGEDDIDNAIANLNQLTFEVTDSCNLKCKYCGYGELYNDYDKRDNTKLSIEKAKTIILLLQKKWASSENKSKIGHTHIGFYGGEPRPYRYVDR